MKLGIPELSLVVLIGPSGSGKSTFAARHFRRTEVLSSDFCRGLVSDDENSQEATPAAFRVLLAIAGERLAAGRLVVVDATNVQAESRRPLVKLAREHDCLVTAIVFDLPESECVARNAERPDRSLPRSVIHRQKDQLRRSMRSMRREGFRAVHVLGSANEVDAAQIDRQRLWVDRRDESGPFDVVGDVHGCLVELRELLDRLGYVVERGDDGWAVRHSEGRRLVFVGDLADRGPDVPGVLTLVMDAVAGGAALCVAGNHDRRLARALAGREVTVAHGLDRSLAQLDAHPEVRRRAGSFLDGLISHYVFDGGRLVVAHAGLREELQGRASARVRDFALYGETTGEVDDVGLPVRLDWARDYRGRALVVYGHVAVAEPRWLNNTVNIDTGCVFGGSLSALRYPEREIVAVAATAEHYPPARPLRAAAADPGPLDLADVVGKRQIEIELLGRVTIREENAAAALEAMSRFAIDPRWLIHLPPTMSPVESSRLPDLLEHPEEALEHYRRQGVDRVICEEKHMGSRAIAVVCRDEEAARRRFGATPPAGLGVCHTRTGRPMFDDVAWEREVLQRTAAAAAGAGLWDELGTDWIVLDCELMPWSAKAGELLARQYGPVGLAGRTSLRRSMEAVAATAARGVDVGELGARLAERADAVDRYVDAYRRYCWTAQRVDDLRLAPFHVLASEGSTHVTRPHAWHLERIDRLCAAGEGFLAPTPRRYVDLADPGSCAAAVTWWEELTADGGEGMVVKPAEFMARRRGRLVQPGIKCRGREYLRVIYGPEYTLAGNLERLRDRGSLARKRTLALSEFALGVEALRRFVAGEPLFRVHECVFGVLALESEPIDPAL